MTAKRKRVILSNFKNLLRFSMIFNMFFISLCAVFEQLFIFMSADAHKKAIVWFIFHAKFWVFFFVSCTFFSMYGSTFPFWAAKDKITFKKQCSDLFFDKLEFQQNYTSLCPNIRYRKWCTFHMQFLFLKFLIAFTLVMFLKSLECKGTMIADKNFYLISSLQCWSKIQNILLYFFPVKKIIHREIQSNSIVAIIYVYCIYIYNTSVLQNSGGIKWWTELLVKTSNKWRIYWKKTTSYTLLLYFNLRCYIFCRAKKIYSSCRRD